MNTENDQTLHSDDQDTQPHGDENGTPPQGDTTPPQGENRDKAEARKWEARAKQNAKELSDFKKAMANVLTPDQAADKDRELAEALAKAGQAESTATRYRVALAEGLPIDLAERLIGSTEDELREDAERLKALLKPAASARDAKGGQNGRQPETKPNPNELLRFLAGK